MTTYNHQPTGVTVEIDDEGYLGIPPRPGRLDPNEVTAIHAAYLAELGLWLDKETGYLVFTTPQGKAYWVLSRGDARPVVWTCHAGESTPDAPQAALDRYVATLTPPQPEPQPGEVWEVTRAGKKVPKAIAALDAVLALHRPFTIWDECDCEDKTSDSHRDIPEVGPTCNRVYRICEACCTGDGYQSEECGDYHIHALDGDYCPTGTVAAIEQALS